MAKIELKEGIGAVEVRGTPGGERDVEFRPVEEERFRPKRELVKPEAEVPIISTETAVDAVRRAQETEKAIVGEVDTDEEARAEPTADELTDLFKFEEEELPAEMSPEAIDARKELERMVSGFDAFRITNAELKSNIGSIVSGFDARIKRMEEIGERREKTFETLGFRTGAQFSGGIRGGVFGGVIAEEERQGVMRVQELEAAKKAEILAAREAARTNNYDIYVKKVNAAEEKYKEQIATIEKLNQLYIDRQQELEAEETAANEVNRRVTLDNAIAGLMAQGVEDPADILDMLNFTEEGELVGDVTLEEITDTIKLLQKTDDLAGRSASVKDFKSFFPDVDLNTPEGYQKYLRFRSQVSAAGRKPEEPEPVPPADVTDPAGDIVSFDEWKLDEEAQRLLSEEQTRQRKTMIPADADKFLREIYNESLKAYKRTAADDTANYTASNIPTFVKDDLIADISADASLQELYNSYPDVSTGYINSLRNTLRKEETADTDLTDEQLLQFLETGELPGG